jgi:ferritin-like metal-binding protein YciE
MFPFNRMIAEAEPEIESFRNDVIIEAKEMVYRRIVEHLEIERYSVEIAKDP